VLNSTRLDSKNIFFNSLDSTRAGLWFPIIKNLIRKFKFKILKTKNEMKKLEFMTNIIVIVNIFVLIPGAYITLKKFK
jgi:hypothetical protein